MIIPRPLFLCLLHCVTLAAHGETSPTPSASPPTPTSCHVASHVSSSGYAPRGGGECGVAIDDGGGIDDDTRDVIRRFLDCRTTKENNTADDEDDLPFHIQGWRWHSMSLIRDSRRLERLSRHLADHLMEEGEDVEAGLDAALAAANYVVNFNMAGLFRIQTDLFVDFLRRHLCDEESLRRFCAGHNAVAETDAFRDLIQVVDMYRVRSVDVGRELYESAKAASKSSESFQNKQRLLGDVARSSRRLVDELAFMRNLQEAFIVPAISRVVASKVQKSFNNKVLLSLGLLESRLHLVGMHDAVWESGIEAEKIKFKEEIPYLARMMIERWRQSLYIPKAGALDYGLTT